MRGHAMRLPVLALFAAALSASAPALAQSDDELDLDDILGEDDDNEEESVRDEKRAVLEGDFDDTVGVADDAIELPGEEESRRIRPIKVLQPKNFLKIGRWELSPHLGWVTNDPFVNRYLVGFEAIYHATEIFGAGISTTYSPNFGTFDYKSVTKQLVEENQVSPDISRITFFSSATLQFSPIYGKVAVGQGIIIFDVYLKGGVGIVFTQDDLKALQGTDDPLAQATANEWHPTSNFGGGIRASFGPNFAAKLEGTSMVYIETVNSVTLEMKNNFLIIGAVSWFFPSME